MDINHILFNTLRGKTFKVKYEVKFRIPKPGEPSLMYKGEFEANTADGLQCRISNLKDTLNPDYEVVIRASDYSIELRDIFKDEIADIAKREIEIYEAINY